MEEKERAMLSENEICEVIREYAQESTYQYAVMIDGEWGCGKTYLIENKIKKLFDEGEPCAGLTYIYVSLYGIASVEALSAAVTAAYFSAIIPRTGNILNLLTAFGLPAFQIIEHTGFALTAGMKRISKLLRDKHVELEKCFFVFDDLERCRMPGIDVLGYINRLMEHNKCKVLIVANERECTEDKESQSELQLIAAQMLKDCMPEKEANRKDQAKSNEESKLRRVQDFSRWLFADKDYRKTKEKVIGKTLRYTPDIKSVVRDIVDKYKKTYDQEFREKLVDACAEVMNDEDVKNLRILQYALSCYAMIMSVISEIEAEEPIKERVKLDVFKSLLHVAIRDKTQYKGQNWDVEWKNREVAFDSVDCKADHSTLTPLEYAMKTFISFRFVHDFIFGGKLDREMARRDLQKYAEIIRPDVQKLNGPLAAFKKGIWDLSEEELRENVEAARKGILADEYEADVLLEVLAHLLYYACECNIDFCECEDLKEHIVQAVREGRISFDFEYDGLWPVRYLGEKTRNVYQQYLEEFKEAQLEETNLALRQRLNVFDTSKWSIDFMRQADECAQECRERQKGFLCFVDVDRLADALLGGRGNDISNVYTAMKAMYRYGMNDFVRDLEPLQKLKERLEEGKIVDRLVAKARDYFCEYIAERIQTIEKLPK